MLNFNHQLKQMKRIILVSLLLASITGFSQSTTFNKADKLLNIGIGFGSFIYSGSSYSMVIPPLSTSFEYGIIDGLINDKASIGVGGYVAFSSYKYENADGNGSTWGYNYTNFVFGGRGSFHYALVDKLDTYAGLTIGFHSLSSKAFGTSLPGFDGPTGGLVYQPYIGARYYFTDSFAVMAELGYGIAYVNMGVAFKF